jgi:hypothetical protein
VVDAFVCQFKDKQKGGNRKQLERDKSKLSIRIKSNFFALVKTKQTRRYDTLQFVPGIGRFQGTKSRDYISANFSSTLCVETMFSLDSRDGAGVVNTSGLHVGAAMPVRRVDPRWFVPPTA